MKLTRRQFVRSTAAGLLSTRTLGTSEGREAAGAVERPVVISTWPFGQAANDEALRVLSRGGSLLDAVEQGIRVTEADSRIPSVGLGGRPNAAGVVQLDACIMHGPTHKAGSVAALEGICHPISAARLVLEKTKHVMLVGEGARLFSLEHGLESVKVNSADLYQKWHERQLREEAATEKPPKSHDTIALLVAGADGNLVGGCSTSGLAGKLPGRVGDSPIIGSGLYVDNEVGAAGATGVGENIMRYCGSFLVVELMRQGLHPQEACRQALRRLLSREFAGTNPSINFVALDKLGRCGAAGTDDSFQYAVATRSNSEVLANPGLG